MSSIFLRHATVVTMDQRRRVIENGAVATEDDRIVAVGKTDDLDRDFMGSENVIEASDMVVLPGLIDAHVHLAQAMIRGCADDVPLIAWLRERVWPLQGNYTAEDGRLSAMLCMLEMIKSGTTTFLESMVHTRYGFRGMAEAVVQAGMRGILSKTVMDLPGYASASGIMHPGMVEEREASLAEAVGMVHEWRGKGNGRIRVWFGPRTPGACTPELYREVGRLAAELGTGITMHLAEVGEDVEYTRKEFGMLPVEFAGDVGLLGENVVLAHAVSLASREIQLLAETGSNVCHCPSSNMKLASGIAKVPEMLLSGVNVALGCDGAPCNNTYDMLREMRMAALLHKVARHDPTVMSAETVLEMATINGARALGMEREIGSLEAGKKADMILLDFRKPHLVPCFNHVSNVVYAASGGDVETVMVDGEILMEKRKVLTMDEERIVEQARERGLEVARRAHIEIEPAWEVL
ncbi:MAG: amidohydrolase [Candidatus Geothermarchaeales archaeon]